MQTMTTASVYAFGQSNKYGLQNICVWKITCSGISEILNTFVANAFIIWV